MSALTLDGNGIAAVIAAIVAAVVSLVTVFMQFVTWRDNRELKRTTSRMEGAGQQRGKTLESLHTQVNGRLSELKIRIAKEAFEMGRRFQRLHPENISPEFPKPMVEELMAQVRDTDQRNEPIG